VDFLLCSISTPLRIFPSVDSVFVSAMHGTVLQTKKASPNASVPTTPVARAVNAVVPSSIKNHGKQELLLYPQLVKARIH
jgi:hypothetical protein